MPIQNAQDVKEKIVTFLQFRGPSLPVHIGREIQQNMIFTGAFLSELLSERRIKTSAINKKYG